MEDLLIKDAPVTNGVESKETVKKCVSFYQKQASKVYMHVLLWQMAPEWKELKQKYFLHFSV